MVTVEQTKEVNSGKPASVSGNTLQHLPLILSGLGRTTLVEHSIDTGDAKPIKTRQYRLLHKMVQELAKQVDGMGQLGILQEVSAAWALPVFLVLKKTPGKYRLVGDMRKLNSVTTSHNS